MSNTNVANVLKGSAVRQQSEVFSRKVDAEEDRSPKIRSELWWSKKKKKTLAEEMTQPDIEIPIIAAPVTKLKEPDHTQKTSFGEI